MIQFVLAWLNSVYFRIPENERKLFRIGVYIVFALMYFVSAGDVGLPENFGVIGTDQEFPISVLLPAMLEYLHRNLRKGTYSAFGTGKNK